MQWTRWQAGSWAGEGRGTCTPLPGNSPSLSDSLKLQPAQPEAGQLVMHYSIRVARHVFGVRI